MVMLFDADGNCIHGLTDCTLEYNSGCSDDVDTLVPFCCVSFAITLSCFSLSWICSSGFMDVTPVLSFFIVFSFRFGLWTVRFPSGLFLGDLLRRTSNVLLAVSIGLLLLPS